MVDVAPAERAELGPITNGDTWAHEPRDQDAPTVTALKADWRRIAELELAECRDRDHADGIAAIWEGRARGARHRIEQLQRERGKVEAALAALR